MSLVATHTWASSSQKKLTSISISSYPSKTLYNIGEPLDTSGLQLELTSSNGTIEIISSGYTVNGFDSSSEGTKTITVSYGGKSATFTVTVVDNSATAPKYAIGSASGSVGQTVEVYVSIENNPGIVSLRNIVTYDSSALELIQVENTGLLNGYTTPYSVISSPYTLRWADSLATENNTSNGNIIKLTFRIKDDAEAGSYDITVKPIEARNFDGTKITFRSASSTIPVVDYIVGDTDGDGEISDWDAILLNRYLAGWDVEVNLLAADVDGDGEISDWDAIMLERYLAGWDIELD